MQLFAGFLSSLIDYFFDIFTSLFFTKMTNYLNNF